MACISENLANQREGGVLTTEGVAPLTDKDVMGWAKLSGMLGQPPFIKELLRSIFAKIREAQKTGKDPEFAETMVTDLLEGF